MKINLYNQDCFNVFHSIKDKSIDLVLTDLPYGTTACKWDSIIDLEKMWIILSKIVKPGSAMLFTAQQPFTWKLCSSNPSGFRYELIWEKPNGTSPFVAKFQPLKKHENILVFGEGKLKYNPQMETGKPYKWNSRRTKGEASNIKQTKDTPINNTGTRFPGSILKFPQERGFHPTQKSVALMEYLIKTYSNEGDTVLDFTMGSGTTGVACVTTNRDFIGIENEKEYFDIAVERLKRMTNSI